MITQVVSKRENIAAVSFAQEILDQSPPDEIAVITAGKYFYGDEEMAILLVDLEEAIRYWQQRGIDPVIDYQHETFKELLPKSE